MVSEIESREVIDRIQRRLMRSAFVNLFIVALLGICLRAAPLVTHFPFVYKNLLHGHSHFAFGGWVLPVLIALMVKGFPEITENIAGKHWKNIVTLTLVSGYGMLVFFPIYGYKGISIFFSTLSIVATVYLAAMICKAAKSVQLKTSHRFLIWGMIYAALSAIGPFATVPLIVNGKQGTPLYFDLIYFYLHFQYNGFFTFTVLALLYRRLDDKGNRVFWLMNGACIPAYALSVLWHQPSILFNYIGGFAALLQVSAVWFLWKDVRNNKSSPLLLISLLAFTVKVFLQAAGAFPAVAVMAYEVRNFVIAYLHLALLGFISVAVFAEVVKNLRSKRLFAFGTAFFFSSFIATESLLLIQALYGVKLSNFLVPYFSQWLLVCSIPFAAGALLMAVAVAKNVPGKRSYKSFLLKERMANQSGTAIQSSITENV